MYEERSAVKIKGRAEARPLWSVIQVVECRQRINRGRLEAPRSGGPRLQNGSGSGEDAGRALVGEFLFGLEQILDVGAIYVLLHIRPSIFSLAARRHEL